MGRFARLGVFCLMGLAIVLARLVEVQFRPETLVVVPPAGSNPDPQASGPGAAGPAPGAEETAAVGPVFRHPRAPAPTRVYVVRQGDTLGKISQRVYGTSRYWKRIEDANRDVIPDPRKMRAGVRLRIPVRETRTRSRETH